MAKVRSRKSVIAAVAAERALGRKIGFTSGAFDLLHAGHARYLAAARKHCDVLVVGVNSDSSVRRYKSPFRPVVPEKERAELVAALASVDHVFLFSEENNARNIELLQPDLYIKGGDYRHKPVTSARLLPDGARVKLIPFSKGLSTSALIEKIQRLPVTSPQTGERFHRAAFLDRDGTLIESMDYPKDPSLVRLLPGVIEGLRDLQSAGFALIVVTNQPGIGLGYYTDEDFFRVDLAMRKLLHAGGVMVDRVFYCPHNEKSSCPCRKPKTYFVDRAARELGIDPAQSWVIGDATSDIEMGRRAGTNTALVETGKGGRDGKFPAAPDIRAANFGAAAKAVLDQVISQSKASSE